MPRSVAVACVLIRDLAERVTQWSATAEAFYGFTAEEAVGRVARELLSTRFPQSLDSIRDALATEGFWNGRLRHVRKDGRELVVASHWTVYRDQNGEPVSVVQAETEIAGSEDVLQGVSPTEDELQLVTENMAAAVTRCSLDLRYIWVSREYAARLGLSREDIAGRHVVDILGKETFDRVRPRIETCLTGVRVQYEAEVNYPTIGPLWINAVYVPTFSNGEVDGWIAVITDIDKRKRAELRTAAQLTITEILAASANIQEAAPEILRSICEVFHWSEGAMWMPDWQEERLQCVARWSQEPAVRGSPSLLHKVWRSRECAWIADVDTDASLTPVAARSGHCAGLAVPIMVADRILAVLNFVIPDTREPSEELLAMFDSVGGHIGQFIERTRAEAALQEAGERSRIAQQAARWGVFDFNFVTGKNYWSPEMEALYGLQPGQFEGTSEDWKRRIHPEDRWRAEQEEERALDTGSYSQDFRVVWPDGSNHWLYARAKVFREADGRALRMLGVNVDITDRKRAEEALKDADRRKDEFLATLAHELRNPLAPLRNGLEVLRLAGKDTRAGEAALAMMDRQLSQMVRLIDDLLDVSRISRGMVDLRKERIPVSAIVRNAMETVRPLVLARSHGLSVKMPAEPVFIEGDLTRLSQVFANLLNNAVKYTERGGHIDVTVTLDDGRAVISIRDNGVGIQPVMLPKIFELFTQGDKSLERSQGGLGIGLTLVKRLVELHAGSVEARSEGPGKGSEFIVRLPVVSAAVIEDSSMSSGEGQMDSTSGLRRVLVVDDNIDAAESLMIMLRLMGKDVCVAHDGMEALDVAAAFQPEAIFLDIGMPKLNGYDTCRRMRKEAWGKSALIIALTGWGQADARRQSIEAGFNHHIVKPVELETLEKLVGRSSVNAVSRA